VQTRELRVALSGDLQRTLERRLVPEWRTHVLAALLALLLWPAELLAAPAVPKLESPVTDTAGILSAGARRELDATLRAYQEKTGHQFAFLSVVDLEGTTIEDFGQAVATAWRLGDEKRDDGLVLLVARTERAVRIEVGYGLEGAVPDAVAARIIRDTIVPEFRQGKFDQGVQGGFDQLMRAAEGEALREGKPSPLVGAEWLRFLPIALIVILYLLGSMSGPRGGRRRLGGLGGWGFGGLPPLGSGGFGGGGRGFGGFSGGGGGFGGGGASGRW